MFKIIKKIWSKIRRESSKDVNKPSDLFSNNFLWCAFFQRSVEEVMIPRSEIQGIKSNATFEEVVGFFCQNQLSFAPVFCKNLDEILGVLEAQNILSLYKKITSVPTTESYLGTSSGINDWHHHMKKVSFIPFAATVLEAFLKINEKKVPMVGVFDEHGGIGGIFSLDHGMQSFVAAYLKEKEQVIPQEDTMIIPQDDGSLLLDGRLSLETLEMVLKIPMLHEEISHIKTVGGWLSNHEGRVPLKGQVIRPAEGWCFVIQERDPRIICKALLIEWPHRKEEVKG
jgi:CBS domain containing-hemolysin-like protein